MSETSGVDTDGAQAQHARRPRRGPAATVLKWIGIALAVVVVAAGSTAAISVAILAGNIDTVAIDGDGAGQSIDKIEGGFNILIVGSDACTEDCAGYGKRDAALNDVTMLLHVSEDQQNAIAVSFPRDLVVPIPACEGEDGSGSNSAMSAQPINTSLSYGGLACTAKTVSALTGLDIQFAGLITFQGVIAMTDAVGGVPVCLTGDLVDERTELDLKAGTVTLEGKQALQFLRSRHAIGDGSDLARISSQQVYLAALVRTLKSNETLSDPGKVIALATAATKNMTLSENFADVPTLASIAVALKDIPLKNVLFVQYPSTTGVGGVYAGKVAPLQDQADELFALIADDEPFTLESNGDGIGAVAEEPSSTASPEPEESTEPTDEPSESSTPAPTASASASASAEPQLDLRGQNAETETCSVTR